MRSFFLHHVVPQAWKVTFTTPISKKGDTFNGKNYRLINLTSIVCKLMKLIINKQLITLYEKIVLDQQHGVMPGRFVMPNLLYCTNIYSSSLDNQQLVDILYLDFAKACDQVSHKKLLHKLNHVEVKSPLYGLNIFLQIANIQFV